MPATTRRLARRPWSRGRPRRPALTLRRRTWTLRRAVEAGGGSPAACWRAPAAGRGAPRRAVGRQQPDYVAAYFGVMRAPAPSPCLLTSVLDASEIREQLELVGAVAATPAGGDRHDKLREGRPTWPVREHRNRTRGPLPPAAGRPERVHPPDQRLAPAARRGSCTARARCCTWRCGWRRALPFGPEERSIAFLPFFAVDARAGVPSAALGRLAGLLDRLRPRADRAGARRARASTPCRRMARLLDQAPIERAAPPALDSFASEPMPASCSSAGGTRCPASRRTSSTG